MKTMKTMNTRARKRRWAAALADGVATSKPAGINFTACPPRPFTACSFSASANKSRIFCSDPPTYLSKISGPFTVFTSRALRT